MFSVSIAFQIKVGKNAKDNLQHYKSNGKRRIKNRRIYERYDVEFQHITLVNEQDILLVRDISEKGFCCEVSERTFARMLNLDQYHCNIRYIQENYEADIEVRWKEKTSDGFFIGFKILAPILKTKQFFTRLLLPVSIACSLQKVEFYAKKNDPNEWWHGVEQSNLFLWFDSLQNILSWLFAWGNNALIWNKGTPLKSALIHDENGIFQMKKAWERARTEHDVVNGKNLQFVYDIFMALSIVQKAQKIHLLNCLTEAKQNGISNNT